MVCALVAQLASGLQAVSPDRQINLNLIVGSLMAAVVRLPAAGSELAELGFQMGCSDRMWPRTKCWEMELVPDGWHGLDWSWGCSCAA